MTGALLGGTVSAATGGKFANGAISGAIQAAMAARGDSSVESANESDAMCGLGNPAIPGGFSIGVSAGVGDDTLTLPGVRAGYDATTGEFFAEGQATVDGFQSEFAARHMTSAWTFSGEQGGIRYRSAITFTSAASGGDVHIVASTALPPTAFGQMLFGSRNMSLNQNIWNGGFPWFSMPQVRQHFASVVGHEFGHGLRLAHMFSGSKALMSYDCGRAGTFYKFSGIYRAAGGQW